MRFLLNQDVYAITARFLSNMGHDVVQVAEMGLARAEDEEILRVAQDQGRILVTGTGTMATWCLSKHWAPESCISACCLPLRMPFMPNLRECQVPTQR